MSQNPSVNSDVRFSGQKLVGTEGMTIAMQDGSNWQRSDGYPGKVNLVYRRKIQKSPLLVVGDGEIYEWWSGIT